MGPCQVMTVQTVIVGRQGFPQSASPEYASQFCFIFTVCCLQKAWTVTLNYKIKYLICEIMTLYLSRPPLWGFLVRACILFFPLLQNYKELQEPNVPVASTQRMISVVVQLMADDHPELHRARLISDTLDRFANMPCDPWRDVLWRDATYGLSKTCSSRSL